MTDPRLLDAPLPRASTPAPPVLPPPRQRTSPATEAYAEAEQDDDLDGLDEFPVAAVPRSVRAVREAELHAEQAPDVPAERRDSKRNELAVLGVSLVTLACTVCAALLAR